MKRTYKINDLQELKRDLLGHAEENRYFYQGYHDSIGFLDAACRKVKKQVILYYLLKILIFAGRSCSEEPLVAKR